MLRHQEELRYIWNKYSREHLGRQVQPFISEGVFNRKNALSFQRRLNRLRRAKQ